MMKEYIAEIETNIIKTISKCECVRSIFVVGSMGNPNYQIKETNDYDIRVLVSEVTTDFLELWDSVMNSCMELAENKYKEIDVSYNNIIGPAKYISGRGKRSLLIHGIVLTESALENLASMHKKSYSQSYYVLFGEDYISRYSSLSLRLKEIFCDTEGVYYCLEHLKKRYLTFLKWETKEGNAYLEEVSESFTPESGYEFLRYSVAKSTKNLMTYYQQTLDMQILKAIQDNADLAKTINSLTYNDFLENSDCFYHMAVSVLEGYCQLYSADNEREECGVST